MFMTDISELKKQLEEKTKLKTEILKELKAINLEIKNLDKIIGQKLPKEKNQLPNPEIIKKKIEKLEFYIATAAYTPAKEKEMIRKIEELKKAYEESLQNSGIWNEISQLKAKLKEKLKQRKEVRKKLSQILEELNKIYKEIIQLGSKKGKQHRPRKQKQSDSKKNLSKTQLKNNKDEEYSLTIEDVIKMNEKEQN